MFKDREARIAAVARKWGRDPAEVSEFVRMISSGPWKFVQEAIDEIETGAEKVLLTANETGPLYRAQGKLSAIRDLTSRIEKIIKEVEDE